MSLPVALSLYETPLKGLFWLPGTGLPHELKLNFKFTKRYRYLSEVYFFWVFYIKYRGI
jgi:hypothetical protein